MPKLTKTFINGLKPTGKEIVYWDSELSCFGLRVRKTGVKSFIVQYRNASGRTRKVTIGPLGRLTPDEARRQARQILADVDRGDDPADNRDKARLAPDMNTLADRYMSDHAELKKKRSSIDRDRRLLERFVRPKIGKVRIEAITREDIAKFHHGMKDTPTQANRVLALLSKMFNLAEKWGLRPDSSNPCRHVERFKEEKRERYLSMEEITRLGAALRKAEQEQSEDISGIIAIRLLLFTGCRREEILSLKWDYVDFEKGCLRLPDSKTGAKLVPLAEPALDVLRTAPRLAGNPYVCPGRKWGSHLVGLPRIWERICTAAGLSRVRLHDLRHSFASVGVGTGLGLPQVGALLGHTQAATTQRYAHLAVDPLRQAANQIVGYIAEAMDKEPEDKVVNIGNAADKSSN